MTHYTDNAEIEEVVSGDLRLYSTMTTGVTNNIYDMKVVDTK